MIQKLRFGLALAVICGFSVAFAPFMTDDLVAFRTGSVRVGVPITLISYGIYVWVSYKRAQKLFEGPYYWEFRRLWGTEGDRVAHGIALTRAFDGGVLTTTRKHHIGAWEELVREEISILPLKRAFRALLGRRYWTRLQLMNGASRKLANDTAVQGEVA